MTEQQFTKISFRDAYTFMLRGLIPALVIGVLAAAIAYFVTRDPVPIYRSTAILLATRPTSGYTSTANVIEPAQVDPDIYRAAVMQGGLLENALARVLEGQTPTSEQMAKWRRKVRVRVDEGLISGLVRVEVEDNDPQLAATVANSVSDALLGWDRDRVGRNVQETVASLDRSVAMIGAQLAAVESSGDTQAIQALRATQEQRIAQLRAAEAMRLSAVILGLLEPFRAAEPDPTPINDRTVFASSIAFALGLSLTYIFMLLRQFTDGRVRHASDVAGIVGRDVVAETPRASGSPKFTNAIGQLCVALPVPSTRGSHDLGSSPPQEGQAFLFTAPNESSERSQLARHVAAAYASGGWRVLLVDADISGGAVSESMPAVQSGATLTKLLNGTDGSAATTLSSSQGSKLDFIPVGSDSGEGGAVLLGRHAASLVREWCMNYEIVIIDSPPLLESAAALTLVPAVDGVVLVVTKFRTHLTALRQASQKLLDGGAPGLHTVLAEATNEKGQKRPARASRPVGYAPSQAVGASSRAKVVERGRKGN